MRRTLCRHFVFWITAGVMVAASQVATAGEKATLRLDWTIGAYQAPFFLALKRGYFADAGIDLDIQEGKGSATTIQLVGRGNDTFGFADGTAVAKSISLGVPVKVIQGIFRRTLMSVIVRDDGTINSPEDLRGKTLTVAAGDANSMIFPAYLRANNIPEGAVSVTPVDASAKFRLIGEGKAQGTVSYGPLVAAFMETLFKVKTKQFNFYDKGIVIFGFGVIASNTTIEKNPALVEKFVAASARGWQDAQKDPAAAISAVVERFPQIKGREAEFESTLKMALDYVDTTNTVGKPFGWMSSEDWRLTEELLVKYLDMKKQSSTDVYYTNQFVKP